VTAALVKVAPELATDESQRLLHGVLGPLMAALDLERKLDRPQRAGPPSYLMSSPHTAGDAIEQGEHSAERERQRLGLREQPIGEIADLVGNQGVQVFALDLPDRMSGLFVQHSSVGSAIVVNAKFDAVRQRLAIAHGYAHAVIEPAGTGRVLHARECEGIDRTTRRRVRGCLPGAGSGCRRNRAADWQGPAESASAVGVRYRGGAVSTGGAALYARVADVDVRRCRVDRAAIRHQLPTGNLPAAWPGVDLWHRREATPETEVR